MKMKFKSVEARQEFIDYGQDRWALPDGRGNNNRKIAKIVGMEAFEIEMSPEESWMPGGTNLFAGWVDIFIDGEQIESISPDEMKFFIVVEE